MNAFERIVGELDYPMHVVTAAEGDERDGCLVGFLTQCSP
jgi:flavin reductase (DIM6/NTAB) family NADH-FMN oxidoreductase RutF